MKAIKFTLNSLPSIFANPLLMQSFNYSSNEFRIQLKVVFTILLLGFSTPIISQTNYYVSSSDANFRNGDSQNTEIIKTLSRYDNLLYLGKSESDANWLYVEYESQKGYIYHTLISPGKAIKSSYRYRVGAVCRDGSRSSATGRGACSHHRGVSRWLYREKVTYRIQH